MSQTAISCPKCQGEMVQGFVLDSTNGPSIAQVGQWAKGVPQRSFWTSFYGVTIAIKKAPSIPIGTFRCQSCGFLESYARKEFAAK